MSHSRLLYSLLHYAVLPGVLVRLALRGLRNRGYWERWDERFGFAPALTEGGTRIWVHAVSVGEVQASLPLVRALREGYADARILVTTTTPTGSERVMQALGGEVAHRYVPYDLPGAVRRFLDRVRPDLVVLMETELWPNILHQCGERGIPVVLVNARLSERSARGYARFGVFTRGMLQHVTAIAAQSEEDARRFASLGADPARMRVTGSVKFDVRVAASVVEEAQVMRRCWGVARGVWIAASTHEGEDEQILAAYARVIRVIPDCMLVLVPRHPERFSRAAALCRRRGYRTVLRTRAPASCADADVFIGDTMGELPVFYAASDIAFVGGSLVQVGGHNMLEPAALGIPVLMGPHVFNFCEISGHLCEAGAARMVRDADELGDAVVEFLSDADLRHSAGECGRAFVGRNRGALERVMRLVGEVLPQPPRRTAALGGDRP